MLAREQRDTEIVEREPAESESNVSKNIMADCKICRIIIRP